MRAFKTIPKYRAKPTNGYASKREAQYAEQLRLRKLAANGDVAYWLEQVPIRLSVGKYVVDFLVFKRDGSYAYVEVKGFQTREWKLKMLALEKERPEVWEKLEVVK